MAKTKAETIKDFQLHVKDVGSSDVQVALLTERIGELTEHLKANQKDFSAQRGLLKMVGLRKRLLSYLERTEPERYAQLIGKLKLK